MKAAVLSALAAFAVAQPAYASPLNGLWRGELRPVANTCTADNGNLRIFFDDYLVHGSRLDKVSNKASGVFRRTTPHGFRLRFTPYDRADIHFDATGQDGVEIVTYTDTFGRCRPDDGRTDCECQTMWQGLFVRAQ
jgi:hypothetical protein